MNTLSAKRERLHEFLDEIDEQKVEALYELFRLDTTVNYVSPLESEEFVAEMNARVERCKTDRSTGISREESKRRAAAVLAKYCAE